MYVCKHIEIMPILVDVNLQYITFQACTYHLRQKMAGFYYESNMHIWGISGKWIE